MYRKVPDKSNNSRDVRGGERRSGCGKKHKGKKGRSTEIVKMRDGKKWL